MTKYKALKNVSSGKTGKLYIPGDYVPLSHLDDEMIQQLVDNEIIEVVKETTKKNTKELEDG
jgi:hypothetical protein